MTGYPTPRLIVHPNAPNKVTWDIVVGVLIVYRCGIALLNPGFFSIVFSSVSALFHLEYYIRKSVS